MDVIGLWGITLRMLFVEMFEKDEFGITLDQNDAFREREFKYVVVRCLHEKFGGGFCQILQPAGFLLGAQEQRMTKIKAGADVAAVSGNEELCTLGTCEPLHEAFHIRVAQVVLRLFQ
ncbi:hypothetical protein D3C71_1121730 [compost metagenome]